MTDQSQYSDLADDMVRTRLAWGRASNLLEPDGWDFTDTKLLVEELVTRLARSYVRTEDALEMMRSILEDHILQTPEEA